MNIFYLANILVFASLMYKSEFIRKRAPVVSIIGSLAGLIYFNVCIQLSITFNPAAFANNPELLDWIIHKLGLAVWQFSYILRSVYLVVAYHINGASVFSSTNSLKIASSKSTLTDQKENKLHPILETILMRFLWAKKINGRFVLKTSMYSKRTLMKVFGTFIFITFIITILGFLFAPNNFISDPWRAGYTFPNLGYTSFGFSLVLLCANAGLLFLVRNGMRSTHEGAPNQCSPRRSFYQNGNSSHRHCLFNCWCCMGFCRDFWSA